MAKAACSKKSVNRVRSGSRLPKKSHAYRSNRGLWLPSSDRAPTNTLWKRRAVKDALKKGTAVFEIDGKYLRVPLTQRLSFRSSCPEDWAGSQERYQKYAEARTVGEAFKLGALVDDLTYNFKTGLLKFLPSLKGKLVSEPLPMKDWPPGIRAGDAHGPWWLPINWAHGIKTTCRTHLPVFIAPNGRTCYHQEVVQAIVQEPLSGVDRMLEWGKAQVLAGRDWNGDSVSFDSDSKLFSCLSHNERSHLPGAGELHFCVVSARRASELSGIRGTVNVQARLHAAGIKPRWFVDVASLKDYRSLGLDAVVGGKLSPARNKALREAARLRKACVQVSDDISGWLFARSNLDAAALRAQGPKVMLKAANDAKKASTISISPLAAARFLLAKMRAAEGRPRLGGVQPTGNAALAMLTKMTTMDGFILGDFFVHDASPCRFDEALTLKEDYDFTCSHLDKHGCVMRCNRLVLSVAHETNAGGAVDVRDAKGDVERKNIKVLMRKWPGVFKLHSRRGDTQVKMKWSLRS